VAWQSTARMETILPIIVGIRIIAYVASGLVCWESRAKYCTQGVFAVEKCTNSVILWP
jgi:uncharacterized iron-regulated membrane protein